MNRLLVVAVALHLRTRLPRRFRDARVVDADAGVDGERRSDAETLEQLVEPPETDAVPVLVPRPVADVGKPDLPLRRHEEQTRHRPRDVPHLDVDDGPEDDAIPTGQRRERRTVDDW